MEHRELVSALAKPPQDIIRTLTQEGVDLWHAATGIAGECGELLEAVPINYTGAIDLNNIIEELGDLEFYIQMVRANQGLERLDLVDEEVRAWPISPDTMIGYAISAAVAGMGILDTVKKFAIYNKPIDRPLLEQQLYHLDQAMAALCLGYGIRRGTVLDCNIVKLSKRYASLNYSDQQAQARADKVG